MSRKNNNIEKELYKYFKVKKRELVLQAEKEYYNTRMKNLKEVMEEFVDDPKEIKKYSNEMKVLRLGALKTSTSLLIETNNVLNIKSALECLTEEYRQLIELRYDEKISYEKISEIYGIAITTVLRRMEKALNEIRKYV